jgi:hypothetical protein
MRYMALFWRYMSLLRASALHQALHLHQPEGTHQPVSRIELCSSCGVSCSIYRGSAISRAVIKTSRSGRAYQIVLRNIDEWSFTNPAILTSPHEPRIAQGWRRLLAHTHRHRSDKPHQQTLSHLTPLSPYAAEVVSKRSSTSRTMRRLAPHHAFLFRAEVHCPFLDSAIRLPTWKSWDAGYQSHRRTMPV